MCRRNHLHGYCMVCFALGLLMGRIVQSGFICFIAGVLFAFVGVGLIRHK